MTKPDRTIIAVALAIGAYGFAFGVVATGTGLRGVHVAVMSVFAYSGGAQAAFVQTLASGTPAAAAFAGLAVNSRLVVYGTLAARTLKAEPVWKRLLGAHLASDETIAITAAAEPNDAGATYWVSGICFFVVWVATTVTGAIVGDTIANPATLGIDAAFPAVFAVLLIPFLTNTATRLAALAGAIVALIAVPTLPVGMPVVAAVAAGLTIGVIGRPKIATEP
ncbi:AzlC family ABC transporter permease [Ilumatobacter sp.]|uniref:AzlC family ABC transporter permease n=1 Tax=Ilumatobacter sp. TaxID=1967498 RepID=UPI003B51EBA1